MLGTWVISSLDVHNSHCIMFLANSFVATAGTNTRKATSKIVHSDLLNKT